MAGLAYCTLACVESFIVVVQSVLLLWQLCYVLSGLLKDIYGQYDEAFFLGGAAMAGAGILMVVSNVHRIVHNRRRREAATQCGE